MAVAADLDAPSSVLRFVESDLRAFERPLVPLEPIGGGYVTLLPGELCRKIGTAAESTAPLRYAFVGDAGLNKWQPSCLGS